MSGFDPNLISSTSSFAGNGANSIGAMEATKSTASMFGADNPFMAKAIQAGGQNIGAEQAAMLAQQASGMGMEGVANAIGSSYQPGSAGSEVARSMYGNTAMNPMQMMMANKALGGLGKQQSQQQQAPQVPQGQIRRGQPVNVSDSITALLSPKLKKKQPISLL
jgi:hypothetical protein